MSIFTARILILIFLQLIFLQLIWPGAGTPASAQSPAYTPAPGSDERKAVMDALRAPVERELKKRVIFKVDHLKLQSGWAFVRGVPEQPGGKAMDYRGTEYQEAIRQGVFDNWFCALLRKQGGKWKVVVYSIGATDVVYEGWDKQYKAPPGIFR
jgi:hypothetical protein